MSCSAAQFHIVTGWAAVVTIIRGDIVDMLQCSAVL